MCRRSRHLVLRPQTLRQHELIQAHFVIHHVSNPLLDEGRGIHYRIPQGIPLVLKQNLNSPSIHRLDNGRIVSPLGRNPHRLLIVIIRIVLVQVPYVALLTEDNERAEDLLILKVVRLLERICDEIARLRHNRDTGCDGLLPLETLSGLRVPRIRFDKEGIRVAIDDECRTTGVLGSRPIEVLNRRLGEHDLLPAICRDGRRQVLESDLEDSGSQLTIQRVRSQLVGKLLGIQKRLPEWIGFLLDLRPLGCSGREKPLDDSGQCGLPGARILGVATDSDSRLDLGRLLPRIGRVRLPDVEGNINPSTPHGLSRRLILFNLAIGPSRLEEIPSQVVVVHPEQRIVADILGLDRRGIQRREITHSNRRPRVKPGSRVQDNRTFVGILLLHDFLAIRTNPRRRRSIEWRRRLSLDYHPRPMTELEDKGLNLDTLASREDHRHWNRTDIRHTHRIVEGLELVIEVHSQVAILNTIGRYKCSVLRGAPVEPKDIGWAYVILDDDPLDRQVRVELQVCLGRCDTKVAIADLGNGELLRELISGLVNENHGTPHFRIPGGGCLEFPGDPAAIGLDLCYGLEFPRHEMLRHLVQLVRGELVSTLDNMIQVNLEASLERQRVEEVVSERRGGESLLLERHLATMTVQATHDLEGLVVADTICQSPLPQVALIKTEDVVADPDIRIGLGEPSEPGEEHGLLSLEGLDGGIGNGVAGVQDEDSALNGSIGTLEYTADLDNGITSAIFCGFRIGNRKLSRMRVAFQIPEECLEWGAGY